MASTVILVAKQTFSTDFNGAPRVVREGETFRKGHPITEGGRADLFKVQEPDNEIEQATAAPGEKRHTRIGRKAKTEASDTEDVAETPDPKPVEETGSEQTAPEAPEPESPKPAAKP